MKSTTGRYIPGVGRTITRANLAIDAKERGHVRRPEEIARDFKNVPELLDVERRHIERVRKLT